MGQKFASYNSAGTVIGFYDSVDSPPPASATVIPITDAEWQDALNSPYRPVTVANGVLTIPAGPTLSQSQTAQIALIQNSANLAKTAPMSFTNGAGTTSSFPMDPVHQTEYLGAYSAFVLGGETLQSGFGFEDVNSVIIPMAVADIKAFYAQGVAGINAITAKKATLVSQINQATSVSAVQAIVW